MRRNTESMADRSALKAHTKQTVYAGVFRTGLSDKTPNYVYPGTKKLSSWHKAGNPEARFDYFTGLQWLDYCRRKRLQYTTISETELKSLSMYTWIGISVIEEL